MAAPSYTTDLLDISTAEVTTNFTAIGGGGAIAAETDFFIQGNACISKATQASWDSGGTPIGGVVFNFGSGVTIPSPGAFFAWIYWWGPGVLATFASGGARLTIGSATTAFDEWNVKGVDDWIFGGWECAVVDPAAFTPDRTVGVPSGTRQYFGWEANVAAAVQIARGNPYGCDVMRYGRGELRITDGDAGNGYATIDGASTYDNDNARRWGQLTPQNGAYFMQGLMVMGLVATAVDMRDSNRVIFIKNTRRVASTFNGFEVRHASSNVEWTNVSVQALGTTSRGFFTVTAGTVTLDTCTFTDMDTFTFLASTSALGCTFRRTNAITAPGSDMTGSTIATPTVAADTGALIWNVATNPDGLLDDMTFSKGTNAHHAIDFGTSVTGNITLRGCEFTGFGATGDSNDSTVRFLATTGSLTLSLVGCTVNGGAATTSTFSVDDAAGIAVTVSIDPVTTLVNIKDETGANEAGVRVYLEGTYVDSGSHTGGNDAADLTDSGQSWTVDEFVGQKVVNTTDGSAGPITANTATTITATLAGGTDNNWDTDDNYIINADLPVDEPVSISRGAGTTATVTHTAHGMKNNEYIKFSGITDDEDDNSGAFQITVNNANEYQYTSNNSGTLTYTGDIRATGATIHGATDANGNISSSRTYSNNQPLTGFARKATTAPYYKPLEIDDTVNSSTGLTINRRLVLDQ